MRFISIFQFRRFSKAMFASQKSGVGHIISYTKVRQIPPLVQTIFLLKDEIFPNLALLIFLAGQRD